VRNCHKKKYSCVLKDPRYGNATAKVLIARVIGRRYRSKKNQKEGFTQKRLTEEARHVGVCDRVRVLTNRIVLRTVVPFYDTM